MLVREFLDHPLQPNRAVTALEGLCGRIARQPSAAVVQDLRDELARRVITVEDYRRLQVLISQMYHLALGWDVQLARDLHTEVQTAYEAGDPACCYENDERSEHMSCPNPDCRRGGCTTEPTNPPTGPRKG